MAQQYRDEPDDRHPRGVQSPTDATCPTIGRRDYSSAGWLIVEVFIEGVWRKGELRSWTRRRGSGWLGNVQYSTGVTQNHHLDTFPVDQIRATSEPPPRD